MKLPLTLICLFLYISSFSQSTGVTLQVFNAQRNWGNFSAYGYNTNAILEDRSIGYGLVLYLPEVSKLRPRLRLGYSKIDEFESVTQISSLTSEIEERETQIHIYPGLLWQANIEKFEIYGGPELAFIWLGKYKWTRTSFIDDENFSDIQFIDKVRTQPGYSIGLGFFAGLRLKLSDNFSVGSEISNHYVLTRIEGEVTNIDDILNQSQTTDLNRRDTGLRGITYTLNVSYWLNNK